MNNLLIMRHLLIIMDNINKDLLSTTNQRLVITINRLHSIIITPIMTPDRCIIRRDSTPSTQGSTCGSMILGNIFVILRIFNRSHRIVCNIRHSILNSSNRTTLRNIVDKQIANHVKQD